MIDVLQEGGFGTPHFFIEILAFAAASWVIVVGLFD